MHIDLPTTTTNVAAAAKATKSEVDKNDIASAKILLTIYLINDSKNETCVLSLLLRLHAAASQINKKYTYPVIIII